MDLERNETALARMDPFTVSWAYYRQLLRQEKLGNPIIMSVEEMDVAVTIKSGKK
jgi:hypothetical protein